MFLGYIIHTDTYTDTYIIYINTAYMYGALEVLEIGLFILVILERKEKKEKVQKIDYAGICELIKKYSLQETSRKVVMARIAEDITKPSQLCLLWNTYFKINENKMASNFLKKISNILLNRFTYEEIFNDNYDETCETTLKKILTLCHTHPKNVAQSNLFKKIIEKGI